MPQLLRNPLLHGAGDGNCSAGGQCYSCLEREARPSPSLWLWAVLETLCQHQSICVSLRDPNPLHPLAFFFFLINFSYIPPALCLISLSISFFVLFLKTRASQTILFMLKNKQTKSLPSSSPILHSPSFSLLPSPSCLWHLPAYADSYCLKIVGGPLLLKQWKTVCRWICHFNVANTPPPLLRLFCNCRLLRLVA